MTAKQIVPITILSITAKKRNFKSSNQNVTPPNKYWVHFLNVFYFRRAQRVPVEKTSKLGLDVILWRTCRFMNIAYSMAIKIKRYAHLG
jgi:hypothetical protein